jgi:hypothetical protein
MTDTPMAKQAWDALRRHVLAQTGMRGMAACK